MNLSEAIVAFPTHESCIAYLEGIRFNCGAYCPKCRSKNVARKSEKRSPKIYKKITVKEKQLVGRWNCRDCKTSFNVLSGTLFQGTKISLQKWIVAITVMVNARNSLSSHQLARDLGLNQKTAWYMMQRIRDEMATDSHVLLEGIIEADKTICCGGMS